MKLVRLRISYAFIRDRLRVDWRDVRFGLAEELLDPMAGIELAIDRVTQQANPSVLLVEVAGLSPDAPLIDLVELVDKLAEEEPPRPEKDTQDRWLFLVLAWLYEHRNDYLDPLARVEEVYADFGYPPAVATFVPYMPMVGPDLGTREANTRRLFERWKRYLDAKAREYAA